MTARDYFDIVVIVPLEEELRELESVFAPIEDRSTALAHRSVLDCGTVPIKALSVLQAGMGRTDAALATSTTLEEFDVGIVVCLGIAGAISDDLALGDVCYSGHIVDVYDNSKTSEPDSEVYVVGTRFVSVNRLSMRLIMASLTNPSAMTARAS